MTLKYDFYNFKQHKEHNWGLPVLGDFVLNEV